ncbi:MAG: cellulase family glycosylhydrolase [Deltaproteobacteria bacterium]
MRSAFIAFLVICSLQAPSWAYYVENGIVYDDDGREVNLYGVNWFGFETGDHVVHGLWARNWKDMIAQIKGLGFTAVRLPFCPETLSNTGTSSINYFLNPDLQGLGSLEVLDEVVQELDRNGMYILIDNHNYDCQSINELWYSGFYSEEDWINDLAFLADRYRDIERFIGIDIKNEPHGAATWGTGNEFTDWNTAAERAAEEVLSVNPDILIFVQGIQDNPVCSGSLSHWWGGNLEPFDCFPLDIPADKLVLSPHVYGPDVFDQPYFGEPDFPDNMPGIWETHFGYLVDRGYSVIIGEFGGRYGHGGDPRDRVLQDALVEYMDGKGMTDFFYWSWNPNSGDTGGILKDDWQNVWQDKVALLQRLMEGSQPEPPDSTECSDGVDNDGDGLIDYPDDPGCENELDNDEFNEQPDGEVITTAVNISDDWGTGYCAQVTVTNSGSSPVDWMVTFDVYGAIRDLWSAAYTQNGSSVTAEGVSWNDIVQGGSSVGFGFCADRNSPPPPPEPTSPPPPAPVYACSDGVDNDGDGLIDYPEDPGCDNAEDNDEFNERPGGGITADVVINDDWGTGYCAEVFVVNSGFGGVDWVVSFTIEGTVRNLWNAVYRQNGNTVTAEGVSWNNIVNGNSSVNFGFCANR